MSIRPILVAALLAIEFAAPIAAQTPNYVDPSVRRGMASRWPAAALIQGSLGSGMLVKDALDAVDAAGNLTPPTPPIAPAPGVADWRTTSLGLPQGIQLDAIASGNGVIPQVTPDGVPDLQAGAWLGLTVSVSNSSLGAAGGPFQNHSGNDNKGSELASYYFNSSEGIAQALVGALTVETNRAQFGLAPGSDIAGLDYGIGFWNRAPAQAPAVLFTRNNLFFFSVTAAWANSHQNLVTFARDPHSSPMAFHRPHGGTIYSMQYNSILQTWSDVYVYAYAADLGLANGDLDALEVDASSDRVIYSAVGNTFELAKIVAPGNQLMVVELTQDPRSFAAGPPGPGEKPRALKDNVGGGPVIIGSPPTTGSSTGTGLGHPDDEVDAVCAIDPDGLYACSLGGIAVVQATADLDQPMGMSIVRCELDAAGQAPIHKIQVTGWGDSTPGTEWLVLYRRDEYLSQPVPIGTPGWGTPVALQRRFAHESQWTFEVTSLPFNPALPLHDQAVTYIALGMTSNPATIHSSSLACAIGK